jgi:hypothetical protein
MTHAAKSQEFRRDKQRFFSSVKNEKLAKRKAGSRDYAFIGANKYLLEQEFRQLYGALKKNPENRDQYWLYCLYCSLMLKAYYEAYGKFKEAGDYNAHANYILNVIHNVSPADSAYETKLENKLAKDVKNLLSTPAHVTKLRDWIGFSNITRIQLVFSKIVVKQALVVAQDLRWLEKLDALLGVHTDVNALTTKINSTTGVFNVLSVGLFVARFILNAGMVLKHTFVPSDAESQMPMFDRFCAEIKKRHCVFLNDIVWPTVNGLTNYAPYFGISAPAANTILAGFLLFDAALLIYSRSLAEQDYLTKREQYCVEKEKYTQQLEEGGENIEADKIRASIEILDEQLDALELSWQTTSATYWFNVTAALLLMGGFSVSLALSAPAALVSFMVCSIGIAMYISAGLFEKYYEKSLIVSDAEIEDENYQTLLNEVSTARSDLLTSLAKNTILPVILVTTFAVSLPATMALICLFIGNECRKSWNNSPSAPALSPPTPDDEEEIPLSLTPA